MSNQLSIFNQINKPTIVVWFSCGAASAVAAKMTIDRYGSIANIRVVNNPIKNEHQDNRRFLVDVGAWLGVTIESSINTKYPNCDITEVFNDKQYMSGIKGATCTKALKKQSRQQWERVNDFDYIVMGFTSDEVARHERFVAVEPYGVLPVLIDAKITKNDCFKILQEAGIKLPKMYNLGFPNANCIGCVKATSATYWNLVRQHFPDIFLERSLQSRAMGTKGCRLVQYKGERLFLDELPADAKGRKLKSMPDCGIFCEVK